MSFVIYILIHNTQIFWKLKFKYFLCQLALLPRSSTHIKIQLLIQNILLSFCLQLKKILFPYTLSISTYVSYIYIQPANTNIKVSLLDKTFYLNNHKQEVKMFLFIIVVAILYVIVSLYILKYFSSHLVWNDNNEEKSCVYLKHKTCIK